MPIIESKEAANYTPTSNPDEHCGLCIHWSSSGTGETGTCQVVSGRVAYQGWCRHFQHMGTAA